MIQALSTEQRVAVARDYAQRVFVGRNAEAAREFFTPDVAWHAAVLGTINGIDNLIPVLAGFVGALDDISNEVQDVIASGDLVALRIVATATQTGNLLGVPPTGRQIRWDAVDIYRVNDDGKITEQWAFEDFAAILSQLGAIKLPWAG
jgi:steroid delta-isomerase-like uncharacterized protein